MRAYQRNGLVVVIALVSWAFANSGLAATIDVNSPYTQATEAAIVSSGLIASYPFNGNANDESGHGNNGTVFGKAPGDTRCTASTVNPCAWSAARTRATRDG